MARSPTPRRARRRRNLVATSRTDAAAERAAAAAPSRDQRLLAALESEARLSYAELGERIGLSKTPTWARVRAL